MEYYYYIIQIISPEAPEVLAQTIASKTISFYNDSTFVIL
jgi:hypothetical protein